FQAEAARSEREGWNSPLGAMPVTTVMSYDLCHLLAHGHGIATAIGAASPIARAHARLAMPFLEHSAPVAYAMQPKRVRVRVTFRVRQGPRFTLACDGQASMQPPDGEPVD